MLLTIVTINLNNKDGLRKTIESVLSQKNCNPADIEYIIIDGASIDGSVDVIKEYAELRKDEFPLKISSWVSEPDTGIYNAMNKGIKKATGDFVALMNSGDSYLPNIFFELKTILEEHRSSIVYGVPNIYIDGIFECVFGCSSETLYKHMVHHNSCFVPMSVYKQYGLYDESYKIAGDYDLFLKFYKNKVNFFYSNRIICNFDYGGISSVPSSVLIDENKRAQLRYGYYVDKSSKLTNKQKLKRFLLSLIKVPIKRILNI